jgi:transcriptional regulator with XRE-family HTH domain
VIDPNDSARQLVLDVLEKTNMRQVEVARRMGLTPKHVNQVLRGRVNMTLAVLDGMLHVCGYRLVLKAVERPVRKIDL